MHSIATDLPVWTTLPFAALLLCIAILPLSFPHFWDQNRNKGLVALALALPILVYLPLAFGARRRGAPGRERVRVPLVHRAARRRCS